MPTDSPDDSRRDRRRLRPEARLGRLALIEQEITLASAVREQQDILARQPQPPEAGDPSPPVRSSRGGLPQSPFMREFTLSLKPVP